MGGLLSAGLELEPFMNCGGLVLELWDLNPNLHLQGLTKSSLELRRIILPGRHGDGLLGLTPKMAARDTLPILSGCVAVYSKTPDGDRRVCRGFS